MFLDLGPDAVFRKNEISRDLDTAVEISVVYASQLSGNGNTVF